MAKIYEKANDQHVGVINLYFSNDISHTSGNGNKGYYADADLTIDPDMDEIVEAFSRGVPLRVIIVDGNQYKNITFVVSAVVRDDGLYSFNAMGALFAFNVDKHGKKVSV